MKEMKLISCTDFVLKLKKGAVHYSECFSDCAKYANFLKTPLELGQFVPCKDGKPLPEPPKIDHNSVSLSDSNDNDELWMDYITAQSKVLFRGFSIHDRGECSKDNPLGGKWVSNGNCAPFSYCTKSNVYPKEWHWAAINKETIEDLVSMDLTLTENAIKMIK